jgi:predicted SprT family Zn-dependent metalloprotease
LKLPFEVSSFSGEFKCPICRDGYEKLRSIEDEGREDEYYCLNCNIVYEIKKLSKVTSSEVPIE